MFLKMSSLSLSVAVKYVCIDASTVLVMSEAALQLVPVE